MKSRFSAIETQFIPKKTTDIYKTAGVKMSILYIFTTIIIAVYFASSSFAEDTFDQGEPMIFSDQELERYKKSSDDFTVISPKKYKKQARRQSSDNKPKRDEEHLKKYWCNKGTQLRKKVEKTREIHAEAKKSYSDNKTLFFYGKISSCRYNSSKSNLEQTEKNLKEAEKNLSDAENEAHRDWIPPGWLRCQF